MQMKTMNPKLPEGSKDIAILMDMQREEVKAWPYYGELRDLFKGYNLNAINKKELIKKLSELSQKCNENKLEFFAVALEKTVQKIKICY